MNGVIFLKKKKRERKKEKKRKENEHKKRVSVFSTTFIWNISHSKKNSARYYNKYTYISM